MLLTTLLCGYAAVVWALPVAISLIILALFTALLPAFSLTGILYARRNWHAFWSAVAVCGAIPVTIVTGWITIVVLDDIDDTSGEMWRLVRRFDRAACYPYALLHLFLLMAGLVGVWMRRTYKPWRASSRK